MTIATAFDATPSARPRIVAQRPGALLRVAAASWLVMAIAGQLLFAAYVLGFYGRTALEERWRAWNQVLAYGYVPGQTVLNLVLGMHLAFAVLIIIAGTLQLLPALRRRMPAMHRWIGRGYLLLVSATATGGLALVWLRGAVGDLTQHVAISLNAVLIVAFAALAWRQIRAGRIACHRRWALRLFLVVSGVWFFRIGLMAWVVVNGGPVGFDPHTFTGPFLSVLAFAQYLLPLALLELYFRAVASQRAGASLAMAAVIGVSTLLTALGSGAAAALMWWPHLGS